MHFGPLAIVLFTVLGAVQADNEEGQALYQKANKLLRAVRIQNAAHIPSRASVLPPSSSTPLLDYLEDVGPPSLASALSVTRKLLRQPRSNHTETDSGLSRLTQRAKSSSPIHGPDIAKRILESRRSSSPLSRNEVRAGIQHISDLLKEAAAQGVDEAWATLGDLSFWGRYGAQQNLTQALHAYQALSEKKGTPSAQSMVGFLKSTGLAGNFTAEGDQASAMLYYTFAALGGDAPAEMTMGYRHWVGIATKQSCADALPFYKSAADKAMAKFYSGPPGGLHLAPHKTRLSDLAGGVYGSGASVASTGVNARSYGHASLHTPTTQQEWDDVLEFYNFHADRGNADFMFRLGRIYYQGFGSLGAIRARPSPKDAARGIELGGRDYGRALKWFHRIARTVWLTDPPKVIRKPLTTGSATIGSYDASKDPKGSKDEHLVMVAGLSSGFLGKMYLRGEGVKQDYAKAFLWFSRGASHADFVSMNGLGIMYRDGLGIAVDQTKALTYFQAASAESLAEAQVNLGRFYLSNNEPNVAAQYFELAIRNGDTFQAYYYLAQLNAHPVARPDLCPIAVAFYKIVAERGDWGHEVWWEAERAWAKGDKQRALLGYWMMAERGYEAAQNNVAWIFDRDNSVLLQHPLLKALSATPNDFLTSKITDRIALTYWTRSAAQENIDALVKMGDYYLKGIGLASGAPQPQKAAACYQSAASTHVSAMAMHNLGWMHEVGVGVQQDFHLAKRYYDQAYETNAEAYLPVSLSLLKLHARSVYHAIKGGGVKSITVQSPFASRAGPDGQPLNSGPNWTLALYHLIRFRFHEAVAAILGSFAPAEPSLHAPHPAETLKDAQRALSEDDDPVQWARHQQERELAQGDGEDDEFLASMGSQSDSDLLETVVIVALCLGVAWLFWYRQARVEAARVEQQQRQNGA